MPDERHTASRSKVEAVANGSGLGSRPRAVLRPMATSPIRRRARNGPVPSSRAPASNRAAAVMASADR
jgi:hypothetical protein